MSTGFRVLDSAAQPLSLPETSALELQGMNAAESATVPCRKAA